MRLCSLPDLKSGYLQLDVQGTGRVSNQSIANMLNSGRFDMSLTETEQLLAQLDVDRDGFVDYTTWLAALVDWKQVCVLFTTAIPSLKRHRMSGQTAAGVSSVGDMDAGSVQTV